MSDVISTKEVDQLINRNIKIVSQAAATVSLASTSVGSYNISSKLGKKHIKRTRRSVDQIRFEIGDEIFKRSYQMDHLSFWKLHKLIFGTDYKKKENTMGRMNVKKN